MSKTVKKDYLLRFHQYAQVSYEMFEVERFFAENPRELENKRPLELLCGALLAACACNTFGEIFKIIFLLDSSSRKKYATKPTLSQIFISNDIADTDVDCILISENHIVFVQSTTLVHKEDCNNSTDRLLKLVKRKCRVQPDDNLHLAVLLNESFDLSVDSVVDSLNSIESIPFGGIHLIGRIGSDANPGEFHCIEVYPHLREPQEIQLRV